MHYDYDISVVITTHNRLNKLKRSFSSAMKQTAKNYEVIIVDDASVDETTDWAKTITCSNVRYYRISDAESSGANHARNIGISLSKGRYLAFLDDDDYWYPTKLEEQLKHALDGYQIVSCYWCVEYGAKNWFKVLSDESDWSLPQLLKECRGGATSVPLLEKRSVLDVGGFDEKVVKGQDHDLWIRLIQHGCSVKTVDKVLVKYYYSDDSTYGSPQKLIQCTEYKLNKYADLYAQYPDAYLYVLNKTAYDLVRYHHCLRSGLEFKKTALALNPRSKYSCFLLAKVKEKRRERNRIIRMNREP